MRFHGESPVLGTKSKTPLRFPEKQHPTEKISEENWVARSSFQHFSKDVMNSIIRIFMDISDRQQSFFLGQGWASNFKCRRK
jgi:hypothetical protein